MPLSFERDLSVANAPFLRSHVMDGRAVLPMAVIVELLAHGALHGNPGIAFHGFDDLRILKGVIIDADEVVRLRVHASRAERDGEFHRVPVELRSSDGTRDFVHARGTMVLANRLPEALPRIEPDLTPYAKSVESVYRDFLFHGPELQGIEEVEGCSTSGIVAHSRCAPPPAQWIERPLRGSWLADPLVIDVAFQLMILWSYEKVGAGSLPVHAKGYRQFRPFPREGARVVIDVTHSTDATATANIEFLDDTGHLVARMEGYECVIDASLDPAFKANRLPQGSSR